MQIIKIAIVGSRSYQNETKIKNFIFKLKEKYGIDNIEIVSGEQPKGVDGLAKKYAIEFGLKYISFPPIHYNWNSHCPNPPYKYGKKYAIYNFFNRNTEIVNYSDIIFCFIPKGINISESKGTYDTYKKAKNLNKKVFIMS